MKQEKARGIWRRWRDNLREPETIGIIPSDSLLDPLEILERAKRSQKRSGALAKKRQEQYVIFPGSLPVCLAILADWHLGGRGVDYMALENDVNIISGTDGMYGLYNGDGVDNWLFARFMRLQREQTIQHDEEWALLEYFLLRAKLVVAVAGNHDNWSYMMAGSDRIRECLKNTRVLYDKHEVEFTLQLAGASWQVKARHKWKGNSVFNDTHGIEVGWQRGTSEFDIGIGSHTHRATLIRPFIRHHEKKFAVLTGTYKTEDEYGRELGYAKSHGSGCGAIIFYPDGRMFACEDLETAADFLTFARGKACN